jgi:hypothetical protein
VASASEPLVSWDESAVLDESVVAVMFPCIPCVPGPSGRS